MKKAKPEIKFEKWKDPYGENIEDVEFPGFSAKVKKAKSAYNDGYGDTETPDSQDEDLNLPPSKPLRFIATSMGHVPLTEYTQPSKIFNFWVGHSTFDITEEIFDIIEKIEGVEILDVFTRYRFRVGIGKMFKDGDVHRQIRNTVYKHLKNTP